MVILMVELPPLIQRFVLHFGEMGGRWGVNRTVGQIYALLFLSDRPLVAEEIADALGMSRSNVSMGLKELEAWRLIRKRHMPGDRREHIEALDDIWQIVRTLAEERRRREVDPTLSLLRDIILETPSSTEEQHAQDKMREMHDMIELLTGWADDVQKLDNESLMRLLALGAGVSRILDLKNKVTLFRGKGNKRDEESAA
jgi:DNA-binding transcriptional regulator GbsR (MarR family)